MSPGRTACAVLGLLLLLAGCGDAATGLPDSVDHAAALPSAAASESVAAAVASDSEVVPEDVPAGTDADEHRASPARAGGSTPVAGPPGAAAPSDRAANRTGSANGPAAPGTPRGALPAPKAVQSPPPVKPAQTLPPRPVVEPTRTPAPLLIDPVDAYGGPLGQFTTIVEGRCGPDAAGCLRVVPRLLEGQSLPIEDGCKVVSSVPNLQPDPDDREKKIAIPGDEVPRTVDTVVNCLEKLGSDAT